jgi:mono/diheme cytochrome c family protein
MKGLLLSLSLALAVGCGGGSKDEDTTPAGGDTTGGSTDTGAGGDTAGGDTAGGSTDTGTPPPAGPTAADQVAQGEKVWGDSCSSCHGNAGEGKGKKNPPVVGEKALAQAKTASDLYTYIKEKMPKDDPGTLSEADAWAVTAWVVSKNGKLGDAALTAESAGSISLH